MPIFLAVKPYLASLPRFRMARAVMIGSDEAEKVKSGQRHFLPNPFIASETRNSFQQRVPPVNSGDKPTLLEANYCPDRLPNSAKEIAGLEDGTHSSLPNPFISSSSDIAESSSINCTQTDTKLSVHDPVEKFADVRTVASPLPNPFINSDLSRLNSTSALISEDFDCAHQIHTSIETCTEAQNEVSPEQNTIAEEKHPLETSLFEERKLENDGSATQLEFSTDNIEDAESVESQSSLWRNKGINERVSSPKPATDHIVSFSQTMLEEKFETKIHDNSLPLLDPGFDSEEGFDSGITPDFFDDSSSISSEKVPAAEYRGIKLLNIVFDELSKGLGTKFSSAELLVVAQRLIALSKTEFVGKIPSAPPERAGYYSWDLVRAFKNAWQVVGTETRNMDHELSPECEQELRLIQQGWTDRKWEF